MAATQNPVPTGARHPRVISWRTKRRLLAAVAAISMFSVVPAWAAGAAGGLDPSWGAGAGYVTTSFVGDYSFADGLAVQDNRTVAVGGVATGVSGDFAIAQYKKNGSLDPSFGTGGRVTTDFSGGTDLATAVAFQDDKLIVVGYTSPDNVTYSWAIARYNKNGSLDPSFGSGGKVVTSFGDGQDFADALAVDGDKVVVAGVVQAGGGGKNFGLARYNKNGSLDQSFGTGGKVTTDFSGGNDAANGVIIVDDRILAVGYGQSPGPGYNFELAQYRKNGTLDPSFGTGGKVTTDFGHGDSAAHAVDVRDNRIAAIGTASNGTNDDFAVAAYDRHGALAPNFGSGGKATLDMGANDAAFGGAFQEDGKVVAVGSTPDDGSGAADKFAVARFTRSGAPDPSFGTGGFTTTMIRTSSAAYAMALGPDNTILAAGYSDLDFAVARYLGQGERERDRER